MIGTSVCVVACHCSIRLQFRFRRLVIIISQSDGLDVSGVRVLLANGIMSISKCVWDTLDLSGNCVVIQDFQIPILIDSVLCSAVESCCR